MGIVWSLVFNNSKKKARKLLLDTSFQDNTDRNFNPLIIIIPISLYSAILNKRNIKNSALQRKTSHTSYILCLHLLLFIYAKYTILSVNNWNYNTNIHSLALPLTSLTWTNFQILTLFAYVLTFNSINGKTIAPLDSQRQTNILSISHNGQSLTPTENLLHGLIINGIFETYNNAMCIQTHNQVHLHTIFYSKWSIINLNWQTSVK